MSKVQKNSMPVAKAAARRVTRNPNAPRYIRDVVSAGNRLADKKCSAILEVETRRERSRTLREYEKQRNQIWALLEDD